MGIDRRISKANERFSENVTARGNVRKSSRDDSWPTSAYIIGLFLFIVVGSAIVDIFKHNK